MKSKGHSGCRNYIYHTDGPFTSSTIKSNLLKTRLYYFASADRKTEIVTSHLQFLIFNCLKLDQRWEAGANRSQVYNVISCIKLVFINALSRNLTSTIGDKKPRKTVHKGKHILIWSSVQGWIIIINTPSKQLITTICSDEWPWRKVK